MCLFPALFDFPPLFLWVEWSICRSSSRTGKLMRTHLLKPESCAQNRASPRASNLFSDSKESVLLVPLWRRSLDWKTTRLWQLPGEINSRGVLCACVTGNNGPLGSAFVERIHNCCPNYRRSDQKQARTLKRVLQIWICRIARPRLLPPGHP